MYICNGTRKEPHEEIVCLDMACPLCETLSDLAATQTELDNLQKEK